VTQKRPETIAAANGIAGDNPLGSVAPPLYLSTTFAFEGFERPGPFEYSRTANPTRSLLAETLARLEEGAGAVAVASGMAAVDLVLSGVEQGRLVLAPHDCYAGTTRLLDERSRRGSFAVKYIDQTDDEALQHAFQQAIAPALVLVETPSNPLMRIADIEKIAGLAHKVGAKVAVDNTFLSPALQRPLKLGADFVIHSTTKYLNGHSDVVGGAVIARAKADAEALAYWANVTGVIGAPFDAYMTLRGVRTLFVRMERQQRNAAAIASYLKTHPAVSSVYYPGLADHPGHDIAARQQTGFGAMLSFELRGGGKAAKSVTEKLAIFTLAESLGGVESLVAHPKSMTHAYLSPARMAAIGLSDGLLRLSVGLEEEADLVGDLSRALDALKA